ncbi:hypothetical protein KPH14_011979 [Odynerus spinipes]|uniref:RING-CH-type domain-containing protein n=1 Tax=Odynerus spinipes TaxID=1348599 RepID=A0AAD9RC40_9HYME|nr:hypothetical protein KPH14_011979 [Odynerus spinipes]
MESQRSNASTTTTLSSVVVGTTDQARTIVSSAKTSSPFYRRNMTPDKRSSHSVIYCRICHEDGSAEELIDPCECSGTLGLIHASCLEKWLSASNTDHCEICKYAFVIEKKSKPLSQWWRSKTVYGPQGIAGDVICLIVLTPLCVAATYLCGIGASSYARLGFWEGTGLAVLCCMLVITYLLWLIVTIRFHFISLRQWRKRNPDVKLIVKHKSEAARVKTYWIVSNDRNNNRPNDNNHYPTCFLAAFGDNDDPLYGIQQQTTFV